MPEQIDHCHPPAMAQKLLELCVPVSSREFLIGDLHEEYAEVQLPQKGRFGAGLWYWKQTLLCSYEFLNKQQGGVMAFFISSAIFIAVILMMVLLGGEISMFVNLPSLLAVLPPAIAFGIGVTSFDSMKLCIKLLISEQQEIPHEQCYRAARFAHVTGNSAIILGILSVIVGAISMASNIEPEMFSRVIGPATAVCLLGLMYAVIIKTFCYVAEEKILLLVSRNIEQAH